MEKTAAFKIGAADGVKLSAAKRDMPSFLKQDRPESVKKIYRALKKDHPEMPAEMKARIASRQGEPGKQHQGPPYKGPLSSEKKAGLVPKKALVATGALAVPYVVGKNVREQRASDGINKSAAIDPRLGRILPNFGSSHEEEIQEAISKHKERIARHGQGEEDARAAARYGGAGALLGSGIGALHGLALSMPGHGGKGALIGAGIGAVTGGGLGGLGGFLKSRERAALLKKTQGMSPEQRRKYFGELARDVKHQEMLSAMYYR